MVRPAESRRDGSRSSIAGSASASFVPCSRPRQDDQHRTETVLVAASMRKVSRWADNRVLCRKTRARGFAQSARPEAASCLSRTEKTEVCAPANSLRTTVPAAPGHGTDVADPGDVYAAAEPGSQPHALAISAALPRHIGAPGTATSVLRSVRTTPSPQTSRS